jgi:hypothetical protein
METEIERLCALVAACGLVRRVIDSQTSHWFEITNFGGAGDGMNMSFRRKAFEVWPGFDERLGRGALIDGGEEHYAFFSLVKRGYRVVYTPHAVVRHPFPRTRKELRVRYVKDLSAATAYMMLLFAEQPRYRRNLITYVMGALCGLSREWRAESAKLRPHIIPKWQRWLALLRGPFLYIRSRSTPSAATSHRVLSLKHTQDTMDRSATSMRRQRTATPAPSQE